MSQLVASLWVVLGVLYGAPTASYAASAATAPAEGFADPAIRAIWQRDDGPVASSAVNRPWLWGPGPFHTDYEPFGGLPLGNHLVQYFDKGRLELNAPGAGPTAGLLVRDLVSGAVQTGMDSFYRIGPAEVPVAGDGGTASSPSYATFAHLTGRASQRQGQPATQLLSADGSTAALAPLPAPVSLGPYEQATGHNWASTFWSFAHDPARPARFDWLTTLGYPITESYWVRVPVSGVERTVLVQLFERRVLTFNPANPPATQVEMGNVGRHYYTWRYGAPRNPDLKARYTVDVRVGRAPQRLTSVSEAVVVTNTTAATLQQIIFRAPWRHWPGALTLGTVTAGDTDAATRWLYDINLEVTLPAGLPPGKSVTVALSFDLKPRPVGGRTGYDRDNDILTLGDMLPTVVPWENGGWQYYPYSDLGDLGYYASSDYSVTVESPAGERLVVGGTGRITDVSAGHDVWRFDARAVRDVAYVVSPRFINPLDDASMTRQQGNLKMLGYFLPEHRAAGQNQLGLVAPALAWFGRNIGAYPFDTFTIAEMGVPLEPTDNYAQEYPMSYFIPSQWLRLGITPGTWTWYTPVHEAGHQWFYSTVGSNQIIDPWLDEAMTTYITSEYVRANFPSRYAAVWADMTAGAPSPRPVSSSVFSGFANEHQYTATAYDTAVVMLDRVRRGMGDDAFYAALRDYYGSFRLLRARPADLLSILQRHTHADLKAIFSSYLSY